MNSLWNFEDGFSIPQEKEVHIGGGCWLPVTPAKPVPPRPLATPNHESENLLGRPNWPEFGAPSNGYLHEITNCSNYVQPSHQCEKLVQTEGFFGLNLDFVERNQTTNQTDGHHTQALGIDNSGSGFATGSLSDILASGDAAFIPSMEESLTRSLVMENEALDLNFPLASNGWIELNAGGTPNATVNNLNVERLNVECQYGIHKSSHMTYDLNSTPTRQADNSHPSGINTTSQFTPITPDHARSENPQLPLFSPLVDESVNQKQGSRADKSSSFTGTEAANPNSDELLQNIVDSFKQKDGAVSGTDEGIDLNRTPQQRQPKRKKHRPKVIKEGKAKRTKTSQTPENPNNVAGNPSGKRKYVRKKGLQETPLTPEGDDVRKNGAATERNTAKSARRALNFDLEEVATEARTVLGRAERRVQADIEDVNTVLNPQSNQQSAANNILLGASGTFVADVAQQNRFVPQYQQGSMHGIASTSMNQNTGPYYSLSQLQAAVQRQSTINHRQLGEESAFTSVHSERPLGLGVGHPNSFISQISPSEQHCNNAGVRKPMFQPKSNLENHVNSRQVLLNRFSQAASNVARGELGLLNGQTHQSISSKVMWQRIFSTLSEAQRKTNIEERLSRVSPLVDNSRDGHMRGPYTDIASMILAAQKNDEMSRSYAANEVNQFLSNGYLQSMALRQQQLLFEQQARSRREQSLLSQMNRRESVTGVENHHFHQHLVRVSPDIPANRQNIRVSAVMNPVPTKLQTIQSRRNPPQSATETRGPTTTVKQKGLATIDDITNRLRNLHLGGEEGAIVPYKGQGTIVPFEGKKPKPRPKVDLDSETNRMWNLLMGKDRSEGLEENNQEKEKWWENEREVFRGRANSFIARMHLVQGDRRFSQWKGSVVDSVIGVFLTQNVSDHLSSSAFISLAARFPLKSTSHSGPCYKGKTKILVEEPEEFAMNGGSAFELHRNLQLVSDQSPMAVHSTRKCWRDDESSVTERTNLFEVQTYSLDEEVISSQGSFDCSTVDGSGGIKSYSGSNSQSEDLGVSHKSEGVHRSASRTSLHGERFLFHDLCNQANGRTSYDHGSESRYEESNNKGCANGFSINTHPITLENQNMYLSSPPTSLHHLQMAQEPRVGNYDVVGKESTSSLSKASTLVGEREANGTTKMIEQALESISRSMVHEKRVPNSVQTQTTSHCIMLSKNQVQQQSCSQTVSQSGVTQPSQTILENATVEPNSNDQFSSSAKTYKEETNAKQARAKGPRAQVEKKIDWDTLRKDVQHKGARKERSFDAMDSLDYEAMRQASIKEISDTIKERGMNNMLAERIKDFLNRLVEEHGSIDLEWLRDVPPDKAKDYLLSVRGLGLKSVECVRLLTLHHLAFPVDTNVGRIAVRLGWVPLQPLPESLQLHLLELYPVLESIQKYLWPRLCKLDQRTLYELHYQLITFGKVFCTKSKPNCNACPMRGECRHFASAFASARLALPGPEDKNIVGSTVPLAEISSSVRINPVPLHPLENHSVKDGQSEAVIQPIIEEPASPEQEHRVLESDIEDGWGEDEDDDDEIPTIKLNMEEFTENLQNFMQNSNMELQEGDMSKALVALNPGVASIPTRKLKNVSRLRTEHQVYELPDDHPLLEGMQKREPDDPSPYLLAIWTPGETANSVHPPEGRCEFQDTGSLCNETTCFSCNSIREANSQTVRGTLLIPCRTAMRGSFPLNGTYFQVNEMFADHDTSVNPIDVPRNSIWNLRRRTVYFGTSVTSIFRGLTTEEIQLCFWKGFVCVRGFEWGTRAPRPLVARLHFPQSKLAKTKKSEH